MCEAPADTATASFAVTPYTDNCAGLYERAEHVLVGVSPGNGYFNKPRLSALLRWAGSRFARVDAIVPDVSLTHTYQALGQPPALAWKNARHKAGKTCRRVARAWDEIGIDRTQQRIHLLSDFADHPHYARLRVHAHRAIDADPTLRKVFHQASRQVLTAYLKGTEPTSEQVEEGTNYLAAEMPLCLDTPAIIGVPSSVAVYHQPMPMIEAIFASPHMDVSPRQGHAIVRPRTTPPNDRTESDHGDDH
ncbi:MULTISPECIES: tRNA-dependent cyclodipeptide synthase [Actinomadura]|uniref:Cyclodipeptide synthase n=1 Tax=Actinomadura yumaensis TaxID=111807 RepID=A0ABW2CCF9_9ACTN|nr:tRNA-dependent cyclodipeptide synthase [Actinomadura sp. J1-007]MWK38471.1 tRNA-dependent cyclodipeptide synthase [Actinomadura sp. J1-007]